MKRLSLFLFFPLFLVSCAGYQLGGNKPKELAHVKKIQVRLFQNKTLIQRAESYATNSAVNAILKDGTYSIGTAENADAILDGIIERIHYSQVSSDRKDTLRSEELSMNLRIKWTVTDANTGKILKQGTSSGSTRFFTGNNLEVARTNALPDALLRASSDMVSRLADGF